MVEPLLRRIAVIGEVAVALLVVEAKEEAAAADGGCDLDGCLPAAERARPDLGRAVRARGPFRHDVDDAADEGAAEARRDVAAIDLDALDVAHGDGRDVDGRVTAEIRQHAVDKDADLRRCRAAHGHSRILPLSIDLAHVDARYHPQEVGQGLLLALKLLGANDGHGAGGKDLLPRGAFRLDGDVGGCVCTVLRGGGWGCRLGGCGGVRQGADQQHPQDTCDEPLLFPFLRHERASVLSKHSYEMFF